MQVSWILLDKMKRAVLLIREMRLHQWVKNLFVFAPAIFSKEIFTPRVLVESVVAFILFSLISSSVYIINDYFDREADREHPVKKSRPIASGELPAVPALVFALALASAVMIVSFLWREGVFFVLMTYFVLNILYTLYLKRVPILDVFFVAIGFDLREAAGGLASGIYLSPWMLVVTFLLALFLASVKRRQELCKLKENAREHREILKEYNIAFLDHLISIIASSTMIAYILYTLSPEIKTKFSANLYLTTPFVLYGLLRYLYLVHMRDLGDDPIEIILYDIPFKLNLLMWGLFVLVIIYFGW